MLRRLVFALAGALSLLANAGPAATQDEHSAGRAIYNYRCYFCHGYSGNGKTVAASFLSPPPADFTAGRPEELGVERILDAVRRGRPGSAMKSFADILTEPQMQAVAAFVFDEFVRRKAVNTRYHTPENGWPAHERYRSAFPFAIGEIPLAQSWDTLTPEQAAGKRLFLGSCISCHARAEGDTAQAAWETRPLSYPRNHYVFGASQPVDAIASASPYALHDIVPKLARASASERRGERLFQANCAFCHGADGSGKNWIGSFLDAHPRNLRDAQFMSNLTRAQFIEAVGNGLVGTSMPAWKNVLSRREIGAIADYVARAFHPFAQRPAPAQQAGDAARRTP